MAFRGGGGDTDRKSSYNVTSHNLNKMKKGKSVRVLYLASMGVVALEIQVIVTPSLGRARGLRYISWFREGGGSNI